MFVGAPVILLQQGDIEDVVFEIRGLLHALTIHIL